MNFSKTFKWIGAATLTLGTTAFVPSFAQAGRIETRGRVEHVEHVQRVEPRVEHREVVRVDRREHVEHIERVHVEPRIEERRVVVHEVPAPIIAAPVYVRIGGLDVPQCVINTANAQCDGRAITTVERGYTNGADCYVIRECGAGRPDLTLSVGLDGTLLSVTQAN